MKRVASLFLVVFMVCSLVSIGSDSGGSGAHRAVGSDRLRGCCDRGDPAGRDF